MTTTITRLSVLCGRCNTESEPVKVPSSSETIEMVDALNSNGWLINDTMTAVLCPDCQLKRDWCTRHFYRGEG